MALLKLNPACKDYIWGGRRLIEEYGKNYDGERLAETWELSCHPDGASVINNTADKGKTLREYIEINGKSVLGTDCERFEDFPVLIKLIDAKDNLSVQVHPNNEYAQKNEGQYGKTEMWYIADCEEGAYLYYGFSKEISGDELRKRIEKNTLTEVLNAVPVHKGDVFFIEAGTIHAIGKNILIAEIQQNSNVTYRVYDYGRKGVDGNTRELHTEKAIDVIKRSPAGKRSFEPHLAKCDYFTVDKLYLDGRYIKCARGNIDEKSFCSILIADGEGLIRNGEEAVKFHKGDSIFLTAGSGEYEIYGQCEALLTTV